MNLSELTNKIYAEGVEKGNAEAAAIVAKAQDHPFSPTLSYGKGRVCGYLESRGYSGMVRRTS